MNHFAYCEAIVNGYASVMTGDRKIFQKQKVLTQKPVIKTKQIGVNLAVNKAKPRGYDSISVLQVACVLVF